MASFNPKVFVRPDGLKRIANVHLIGLLEPWRDYFHGRGFEFPADPEQDFPHDDLAKILLTYDPDMPLELMNGLYYIDEAASDETLRTSSSAQPKRESRLLRTGNRRVPTLRSRSIWRTAPSWRPAP